MRLAGSALHIPHDLFVERREENAAVGLGDVRDVPGPELRRVGSLFSDLKLMINLMLKYLGFGRTSSSNLLFLVRSGCPHLTAVLDFLTNSFATPSIFSMPRNSFKEILWTCF